jgi:hypothetical protein
MRRPADRARGLGALLLAASVLLGGAAPAPAADSPLVACSAETPSVPFGGAVVLRTWATAPAGRTLTYAWEATAGRLEATRDRARWDLADVRPGGYAATVRVKGVGAEPAACTVRVIVRRDAGTRGPAARSPAPARETGSALLVGGASEADGYGLYSYLLLGAPPEPAARDRYVKALEAFREMIPEIAGLEQYVDRRALNVAYVPVRAAPPAALSADWILTNYDYARARSLLRHLPGPARDGPYIVSTLRPAGALGASAFASGQYLFQDLTAVPPPLVASWVKEFLNQAAQERYWDERAGTRLALRLRLTVGILGAGLPEVRKALDTWIAWVR